MTDYEKQAEKFLADNKIKFVAELSDTLAPAWAEKGYGHHYRVTLSKGNRGQGVKFGQRVTFNFWGSIRDKEDGKTAITSYDALACLSSDVNCPVEFKDFCAEYGYNEDSRKALDTFKRCSAFGRRLQAFFTAAELEQLQEIN